MANTRETLGDQATLNGLVGRTLTTFEEDGVTTLGTNALARQSQMTSVKFPNLTKTGANAFQYCSGLTTLDEENFPNLGIIDSNAFANCTGLTSVKFPSVTTVSNNAFNGCTNLEKFETGVNKVAFTTPFASCGKLKELVVNSTQMSTLNSATGLAGTAIANYQGAVYVPDDLVDTYKGNANWKTYFIISKNDYPLSQFPDKGTYFNSAEVIASWTEVINNENYATDYAVGKTLPITFGSYGTHQMELIAIDTDIRADGDETKNGGKARMTWMCKDCLTTHNMNSSNTNANGWPNTAMRSWLRSDVLPLMPEILRNNIVEVSKTYYDYTSKTTKTGSDTIWIPSLREMFGPNSSNGSWATAESSGVDYTAKFVDNASRIKKNGSSNTYWWMRSARSYNSNDFLYVYSDGSLRGYNASNAYGVVPCFCI